MEEFINLFTTWQMQIIVVAILLDVLLGIIAAIVKKDFVLGKLANFMKGPVIGYVLGFAILEIIAQALPFLAFIVWVGFVLIVLALLGSILGNLNKMGVPMLGVLKKK